MLSTNCINCCFNTGSQCSAVVGADENFARQCSFKKTKDEFELDEFKHGLQLDAKSSEKLLEEISGDGE